MKIALVTDAWKPQTNGVVNTLSNLTETLRSKGNEVEVIEPQQFNTIKLPNYNEIQIAVNPWRAIKMLNSVRPEYIHICTEGPIGLAVRVWCSFKRIPFTTSYHTKFPEYFKIYLRIPVWLGYLYVSWFHNHACRTMVSTKNLQRELHSKINKTEFWRRGVNTNLFNPNKKKKLPYKGPIWLNVGRISPEKNLEAFLKLELPGTKIVVGDGPMLKNYRQRYPEVIWTGYKFGEDLSEYYASSDVFVFPSLTETFGNVCLESIVSGTPVVSYNVNGPTEIIRDGVTGIICDDLRNGCFKALELDREEVAKEASFWSWSNSAESFSNNLEKIN